MPFDGSSIEGFQAINESDMKLVPDIETAFVDPFRKHKTLDVAFSIVDPLTDEPYSRDPRQVAAKAEAYLKSTGVADTASFAPEAEFFIFDKVRFGNDMRGSFYEVDSIEGTVEIPDWTSRKTALRTSASRTVSSAVTSRFHRPTTPRICVTTWSPTCRRSASSSNVHTMKSPAQASRRSTTASTPCSMQAMTS